MDIKETKCGTAAVIGKSNAGKSTLINVLAGAKVSITSPKPQTTRDRILGILTEKDYQIIFVDTPGIYKSKNILSSRMQKTISGTARDVDIILYVIDAHKEISEDDIKLLSKYSGYEIKTIVVLAKTDITEKEKLVEKIRFISEKVENVEIIPVSARKNVNLRVLLKLITDNLPEGEFIYPADILSDKSDSFMICEIMREKLLLLYDNEIPHGVMININKFSLRKDKKLYDIDLDIICEKQNHKAIIIGKNGEALKNALTLAREGMEKFLGRKVFLSAFVKVEEDWRNNDRFVNKYFEEEV